MKVPALVFFLCTISWLHAQTVEWASDVIRFSTEYSRKQYSSKQAIGKPDKLPATGESPCAWAPQQPDNPAGEFIHVSFEKPIRIRQVAVGENDGSGSIKEIILFSADGKKHTVYQNDTMHTRFGGPGRMFHCIFPLTDYEVKEVKVVLNTKAITGMNQVDCIGISDSETPVEATINEITYKEKIPPAENLGPLVNSTSDDMLPIISPDGETLYFGRKKHPENIGEEKRDDIWVSAKDAGKWTKAINIGPPLNNENHNYLAWISADGNTALLANNYQKVKQDISLSRKTATGWSQPKALKINNFYNNNEFSCYHANTECNVILMAIEREDSYGDMDIYVSILQKNGVWTEPKNMGRTVNSAATEGSVFLATDNRTIYFASDGFSGYGKFDMFMSRRLDDTWLNWSEPVNLGSSINSKGNDYYYTIPASGDYAYFSSTANSYGGADLYRIPLPKEIQPDPVTLVSGKIIDADTKKPVDAEVEYGSLINDEPKGISSGTDGNFQVVIPEENYGVTVKKEGYFPVTKKLDETIDFENIDYDAADPIETIKHNVTIEVHADLKKENGIDSEELERKIRESVKEEIQKEGVQENPGETDKIVGEITHDIHETTPDSVFAKKEENIEMIPLRAGEVMRLDNIFFEANKSFLKEESKVSLDQAVAFLKENPKIYVEIGGHTNSLPGDEFCEKLSNDRAHTVADYFIAAGIPADHVTWKGYGKTQPIADNSTLTGRQKNQRVELKILKVE